MTGFLLLFAQQMSGKPDFEFTGLPEQSLLDRAASQLPHNPSLLLVSVVGAWFLLLGLLLGLLLSIRYRVGPRHFIVTLLGVPVRRVRLDNIKYMNTAAPALAEAWHCRLFPPPHSILVITLACSLHAELLKAHARTRTVGIRIRYTGFITCTRSVSLPHADNNLMVIKKAVRSLTEEFWTGKPVRLIGIRLSGLVYHDPKQCTLEQFFSE